jgi:hypothetical protein
MENEMAVGLSPEAVFQEEAVVHREERGTLDGSAQELLSEITHISARAEAQVAEVEQGFQGEKTLAESGAVLGLNTTESTAALDGVNFTARLESLHDRLGKNTERLEGAMKRAVGVAASAFVLSLATPVFAENPTTIGEALTQRENPTLAVEQAPLPSYEEAKQRLRASILTAPSEERAIFVRIKDGAPMKTLIYKKGESASVGMTDGEYEEFLAAMKSRTATIEDVHTHPVHALKSVGFISSTEAEAMSRGDMVPASLEPSVTDWNMLFMHDETYSFPPGQMSHRVIDPTGEWEYGVSDSGSSFIEGMRKGREEIDGLTDLADLGLDADVLTYLKGVVGENESVAQVLSKIFNGEDGTVEVRKKLLDRVATITSKYVSVHDMSKYAELISPLSITMNREERQTRALRMKELAASLGFRLSYTPNPDLVKMAP